PGAAGGPDQPLGDQEMSSKGIVLKRNDRDEEKLNALNALAPLVFVEYRGASQPAGMATNFGQLDYLLVTGGHGDFQNKQPTTFNDAEIPSTKTWIANSKGEIEAIILDTCFSSAVAASFLKFLTPDGCLVCAH